MILFLSVISVISSGDVSASSTSPIFSSRFSDGKASVLIVKRMPMNTVGFSGTVMPLPFDAILNVFLLRRVNKMIWIYTPRIIAVMAGVLFGP